MMNPLLKYWQFTLLGVFLIVALIGLLGFGINYGIDFKGGTLYQVELQKVVAADEIARIANIIQQRIDPSGLRGDILSPVGGQYIMIQTAETNPTELEKIESRIRQQGKFEAVLNGEILFTGDEIKKVDRKSGFGVAKIGNYYQWNLPFILNETAAKRFSEMTFHQCTATSLSSTGQPTYDCESTTFFLDKPSALIVIGENQYALDSEQLSIGNTLFNIPSGTLIEDVIDDSQLPVIAYTDASSLDENVLATALKTSTTAIVSPDLNDSVVATLEARGFTVIRKDASDGAPWIWDAMNAKQIIRLSEGITNEDVADISQAKIFSQLNISGNRDSALAAQKDLEELAILLESGSLPTPVKSISKETISPALGKTFLNNIVLMGVLAVIIVALVIIIRYRNWRFALPILLTVMSEIIILTGFLSLPFTRLPFDLAAFAGLIAAIGAGVNAEIVIIDELTSGIKKETVSLFQRIKNGLFIVTTSALTVIGVMGPIIVLSRSMPGLSNLYGFAAVAILGAIIGAMITRPAFSKTIEIMLEHIERDKKE